MERNAGWVTAVIRFLRHNTPSDSRGGWEHRAISAFEGSCEALVALGQADPTRFGATPHADPEVPPVLPDVEFIRVTVLDLAEQVGKLEYQSRATTATALNSARPAHASGQPRSFPDPQSIEGEEPCGPAIATPEVWDICVALGLVSGGRWTEDARRSLRSIGPDVWVTPRAVNPPDSTP